MQRIISWNYAISTPHKPSGSNKINLNQKGAVKHKKTCKTTEASQVC